MELKKAIKMNYQKIVMILIKPYHIIKNTNQKIEIMIKIK